VTSKETASLSPKPTLQTWTFGTLSGIEKHQITSCHAHPIHKPKMEQGTTSSVQSDKRLIVEKLQLRINFMKGMSSHQNDGQTKTTKR